MTTGLQFQITIERHRKPWWDFPYAVTIEHGIHQRYGFASTLWGARSQARRLARDWARDMARAVETYDYTLNVEVTP